MKVVERYKKELVAHQFTKDNKDSIFFLLHWYNCSVDPSFDKDGKPIMKIRFGEEYKEHTINFGDYIILDNTNDKVVEVLSEKEFNNKYEIYDMIPPSNGNITEIAEYNNGDITKMVEYNHSFDTGSVNYSSHTSENKNTTAHL